MTKEETETLIHMNQRLSFLLGFAMRFVIEFHTEDEEEKEKKEWLIKAVENIIYLGKPLLKIPGK
jgi:hypothetical protein